MNSIPAVTDDVWGYKYYYADYNDRVVVVIPVTLNIETTKLFKPEGDWIIFNSGKFGFAQSIIKLTELSKIFKKDVIKEHVRDYIRNWVVQYKYLSYSIIYQQGWIYLSSGKLSSSIQFSELNGVFLNDITL